MDAEDLHVHLPYTERTIGAILRDDEIYDADATPAERAAIARREFSADRQLQML